MPTRHLLRLGQVVEQEMLIYFEAQALLSAKIVFHKTLTLTTELQEQ
jgi:hypothetical protein